MESFKTAEEIVRVENRALSSVESQAVDELKVLYANVMQELINFRDNALKSEQKDGLEAARLYSIAIERAEESCMWAVKGLTT